MKLGKFELDKIYCGDCLELMKDIPGESIDLCYSDPPFFTNKDFKYFSDKWGDLNDYIGFIKLRVIEIYRILKNTGSFYLHCDWHAGHYLKVICDDIFGYRNFRNEIIWCYTGPSRTSKYFVRKHDNILFYTKTDNYIFNTESLRVKYKKSTKWAGKTSFTGLTPKETVEKLDKRGKLLEDWWIDVAGIGYAHKQITGFATQKPEALLKRIILASSNIDDIILDPFFGSGTTLVVAKKLNRYYLGFDISDEAYQITNNRLENVQINIL